MMKCFVFCHKSVFDFFILTVVNIQTAVQRDLYDMIMWCSPEPELYKPAVWLCSAVKYF